MIKVLIIDDEEVVRVGLKKYISWEKLGIAEVYMAEGADRAMEHVDAQKPDIIISDIRMPKMDGITLCKYIKTHHEAARIIFLSGYADKEYLKGAIQLSAEEYIEKPVDIQLMEECLEKVVKKCQKDRENLKKERELEWYRNTSDRKIQEEALQELTKEKWEGDDAELIKKAGYNEAVQRIVEYVKQHFMEPDMSIKQIADAVYVSPTYLTSFFKSKTGKTIGQYIKDVRMEYALLLLTKRQYSVLEIAEKCGYADGNYFAKAFKKEKGMSPSEYRESIKE